METRNLRAESAELLNRQMDDVIAVSEHAIRARWVALHGDNLGLPALFERAVANLHAHVDRLADRVLALEGVPVGGATVLLAPSAAPCEAPEHASRLLRMLARLLRATRMRVDVARAIGDGESANLLAQAGASLELLIWQLDHVSQAQD